MPARDATLRMEKCAYPSSMSISRAASTILEAVLLPSRRLGALRRFLTGGIVSDRSMAEAQRTMRSPGRTSRTLAFDTDSLFRTLLSYKDTNAPFGDSMFQ